MLTVIESIATANPPHCVAQPDAALNMQRVEEISPQLRKRIPHIYQLSGIERRFTCVSDYARDPNLHDFEPRTWPVSQFSTTRTRNEHYKHSVVPLAEAAAKEALESASISPQEITHVIVVSCTGFFAPGLDIHLVKSLGMRPTTERTLIGFMGCYAAFNALRVADAFCKSNSDARVLIVCAELCSLHFQIESTIESVVVNAIFADGVAATIVRSREIDDPACAGKLAYVRGMSILDDDSMGHMSWEIGDTGFLMGLSSKVPDVLARQLPEYIEQLLRSEKLHRNNVGFWAIHPGGRQIVDKAQEVLGLNDAETADSYSILRRFGNMSAPTILFILKRIMEKYPVSEKSDYGVAMAFGPGLTIEGCLLKRLS